MCASLIIVGPARCVFDIWKEFSQFPADDYSGVANALRLLSYGFYLLIVGFGATAGILLWRVHRRGRELVKVYLVVQFLSVLCVATMMMLAEDEMLNGVAGDASDPVSGAFVWTLVYGIDWWTYLDRSYRVKKTYELKYAIRQSLGS